MPLIGLPGRRRQLRQVADMPETMAAADVDLYFADNARGIVEAGGLPVHLPLDIDPEAIASRLDGILLTGGADVGPERYGSEPETDLFPPEPLRDDFELALIKAAVARRIPMLGICRGLQLMNVHAGGTLHQHIPSHSRFDIAPDSEVHAVDFTPGSVLAGLYGHRIHVNSLHHQTVDEVGAGYTVTARAGDGTVEGLEHQELPVLAVQWHPEMLAGRHCDPVFSWLVDAARAQASL